jgi:small subunit ribosomal protein S20
MANNMQQKKRIRQDRRRSERNRSIRSELRTRSRRVLAAAEDGDAAGAEEMLRIAQKRIDVAASKGVLHKRTAARRKARLTHRVNSLLSG